MLLAFSAAKMHDFYAENNYICELCETVVDEIKAHNHDLVEDLVQKFPALEPFVGMIEEALAAGEDKVCDLLKLCDNSVQHFESELSDHLKHISIVNSNPESTWVAGENDKFTGMSVKEIKSLMGTVVDPVWTYKAEKILSNNLKAELPATFDARTNWPQCASVIGHIRDQSNCGSCWAHGTTEAFNDRYCIKSNGADTVLLSVADTTGCCGFLSCLSMGCNGGQIGTPWSWFQRTGVVTGGDFGDSATCYPYTMERCSHHTTGSLPACSDVKQVAPTCDKKCQNSADYNNDKHKVSTNYGFSSVDDIKKDLVTYGSVTAAFTVYEDFINYKSGVYKHVSGNALGGHAVKIIGYGEDHWIVVNSWNENWGDNGTFKIAFGECGIDSQCHAGRV